MNRLHLAFLTLLPLLAHSGQAQTGVADGSVVDADGKAVKGATVSVIPLDRHDSGNSPSSFSGADGTFMLSSLPTGRYRVYAWNEASGVPNPRMLLFQHSNPHSYEITVRANEIVHVGNIVLPRPYGRVTLRIVDSKTKLPIALARCTLRRADVANVMYATDSTNGKFSFLLPDSPISLKVTSSGYEDWSYLEPSDAKPYLVLESGKQTTILVDLEAKSPKN